MQIAFTFGSAPSNNFTYEYISNSPGWGIGAYFAVLTFDVPTTQGYERGVAFNALFRNDPTLQVIKVPV